MNLQNLFNDHLRYSAAIQSAFAKHSASPISPSSDVKYSIYGLAKHDLQSAGVQSFKYKTDLSADWTDADTDFDGNTYKKLYYVKDLQDAEGAEVTLTEQEKVDSGRLTFVKAGTVTLDKGQFSVTGINMSASNLYSGFSTLGEIAVNILGYDKYSISSVLVSGSVSGEGISFADIEINNLDSSRVYQGPVTGITPVIIKNFKLVIEGSDKTAEFLAQLPKDFTVTSSGRVIGPWTLSLSK